MKTFEVTLEYFVIKDGVARAAPGSMRLGRKGPLELLQILMTFEDMNPIQGFVGEPVITLTATKGGSRYLVRTDLHKLILSDARRPMEPSHVLEAASLLLEIEDSQKRLRQQLDRQLSLAASLAEETAEKESARRSPPYWQGLSRAFPLLRLAGASLLFAWALQSILNPVTKEPVWIGAEGGLPSLQQARQGTYATGTLRGDHELLILPTGELQFTQLGYTPVRQARTPYRLGRLEGALCLWTEDFQPVFPEQGTLRMGTLVFRRQ